MAVNGLRSYELVPGENEIIQRLSPSSYTDPEITKELYEFGSQLLRERTDRTNWIDTKAGAFAGFAGALIVIVVSTFPGWKDLTKEWTAAPIEPCISFLFFGLVALLLSAVCAIQALHARRFQELDEKDLWFAKEYFDYPDQLRRYYLIGMYRSVVSHDINNDKKAWWLIWAERATVIGAVLLAIGLLWETWHLGASRALAFLGAW
jgi:Co/Zn/Cd efflux system component